MAAVLEQKLAHAPSAAAPAAAPIVIVGAGPVGVRVASELQRRDPAALVVLYGAEPEEPYNRVRLSALLAGEITWTAWTQDTMLSESSMVERRLGCAVTQIERSQQYIRDAAGRIQPYSRLVIATGSTPHIPNLPNVGLAGVYTFRDLKDVQQLFARRMRSRRTVVLGGGLLGLEAARAMRRYHTHVTVVEHAPRPMPRQLDDGGGERLAEHLRDMGIEMVLGEGVRRIDGEERVSGVELMNGNHIECDTVVIATGIRPSVELARRAGLSIGRGIRVDDEMRTSDPAIFAVGECAEHRDTVYGLVAPGYEQAAVAACLLAGGTASYRGSTTATRLKVVGVPVFSIGRVADDDLSSDAKREVFRSGSTYCKVTVEKRRLVGAMAIGDSPEIGRLQEAVIHARTVWPWQLMRFKRSGRLWRERKARHIRYWPDSVAVCNCTGVTRGALGKAMSAGACTVAALASQTGASTVCGSCRPLLAQLCGTRELMPTVRGWRILAGLTLLASFVAVLLLLPASVGYQESVQGSWPLDVLWRSNFWKQVSGYSTLGLTVLALIMSLRKRIKRFAWGDFAYWRIVHTALALVAILALLVHTGGRLGGNLNSALMGSFVLLLVTGVGIGAVMSWQHRWQGEVMRWRSQFAWAHILLFWPVPLLLGFHIFKSYYF